MLNFGKISCPHYDMVPKDYGANLAFRKEMLNMAGTDSKAAAQIFTMCQEDLLFYVNTFCLAAGTLVVTGRGLVCVEDVLPADIVWDGENWVSQEGVLTKGRKSTIFAYGIRLTPNHKVRTDHGWTRCDERYDREEVRLPGGYLSKWKLPRNEARRMAVPMRMRQRMDRGWRELTSWISRKLWMQKGREGDSRDEQGSSVCEVERHESALSESKEQILLSLRWKGNKRRSNLDEIREFSGRYGRASSGFDHGAHRQQRELHEVELQMGHSEGTGEQYSAQCKARNIKGAADYIGDSGHRGRWVQHHPEATGAGADGRQSSAPEVQQITEVYDLLNCGPKHAFTVIGADGRALLVHNCWTFSPKDKPGENPVTPFNTYADFQDEVMMSIADCIVVGEDFVMPKSRDMGASWMGLTVFEWFWHFREHQSFLLISRNEDYVDKSGNLKALFWKIDFLHQNQPNWLLPSGRWLKKDPNRTMLHLGNADNHSVIDGESTTGDAGRGDRRTAMFIDEHAAFKLDDGYKVLKASRDTTNCRGFNSTPQGANNAFYEVVHETAARELRMHWSSHPLKNPGLYTSKDGKVELLDSFRGIVPFKRKGDKAVQHVRFPEDYPFIISDEFPLRSPWFDVECTRCVSTMEINQELEIDFLGSDYQFFDPESIKILIKKYCRTYNSMGMLEIDQDTCEPKRFYEDPAKGCLYLWLDLTPEGRVPADRQFVLGSDVSAGTGASNSVSCVVDRATGEKVGVFKTPRLYPTPFASMSIAIAKFFNNAFMVWDASGPTGKVFTQRVIKTGYGNIYYRRNEKKIGQQITDEPGYFLNPTAKAALLEDYRAALAAHRYINRSELGMKECLQFIRKSDQSIEHSASANSQDPSGARTAHGDEVIADALACLGVAEYESQPKPQAPEVPAGSLAFRRQQKQLAASSAARDELGDGW